MKIKIMSDEEKSNSEFMFDVIKLIVGTIIFVIISFLLQTWESQRETILGSSTPGVGMYILVPLLVGVLVFGATVFIQGVFSVGGVILTQARQSNVE